MASGSLVTFSCPGAPSPTWGVTVTAVTTQTCSQGSSTQAFPNAVSTLCCSGPSGTAYAKADRANVTQSTCFIGYAGCKTNDTNGNGNWGWFNRFIGNGTNGTTGTIITGAGQCKGGTNVGSVAVTCTNTRVNSSTVSMSINSQVFTVDRTKAVEPHFYLGCAAPTDCNPPSYGACSDATGNNCPACSSTSSKSCGGNLPAILNGTQTFSIGCACNNVYWVLHEGKGSGYTSNTRGPDGACVYGTALN